MTTTRRALVLIGALVAVMIGTSATASASFADSVARTTSITTHTVQAPGNVTINDYCVTTTTTVKRTVYRNPYTGATTQTGYSSTTSTASATSNVQGTTTSSVAGPGANETTTTTVTKNTDLYVTVSWSASSSPRVTGYVISASISGQVLPMMTTTATTTGQVVQDADVLSYQPRVTVTTQTAYGWTASSPLSGIVAC